MTTHLGKSRSIAMFVVFGLVMGITVLTGGMPASAAGVTGVSWNVVYDGTAPFDSEDGTAKDSGAKNGIVRTQDTVAWEMIVDTVQDGTSAFVITLPTGMQWTTESTSSTVCNGTGGGTISANGSVLTCNRTFSAGSTALPVAARVGSVGNGTLLAPSVTVDGRTYVAPNPVTVTGEPKTKLSLFTNAASGGVQTANGPGFMVSGGGYFGDEYNPQNPKYFGYEALSDTLTFTIDMPANATMQAISRRSGVSGNYTFVQDGPGQPVTVTITNLTSNYLTTWVDPAIAGLTATGLSGNARMIAAFSWSFTVPYEGTVALGQTVTARATVRGFDPVSVSGASNFGAGYAPGYDPSFNCPANSTSGASASCIAATFTRASGPAVGASNGGAVNGDQSNLLYADWHGSTSGTEATLPGQAFTAMNGIYNGTNASAPATGAYASITWDPKLISLREAPRLMKRASGTADSFYTFSNVGGAALIPLADYSLEYTNFAFADNADRKARLSFADPAIEWVTDPTTLPGGIASVSSVRFKYSGEIEPNSVLGLVTPMTRSLETTGLPAKTSLPWFWQYGTAEKAVTKSPYTGAGASNLGGSVQTAEALIRTDVAWQQVEGQTQTPFYPAGSAQRGDIVGLRVTPVVVGPVGTSNSTVAEDTTFTVTLPNACLEPVESALPPSVTEYIPGVPGATCLSGTPAKLILKLGDLTAPGGAAGPAPYQGHAVAQDAIQIPVKVSMDTPIPSTATVGLFVESVSDPTSADYTTTAQATATALAQDRTYTAGLTVSGAASFKSSKIATTVKAGYVGPGETMTYTISWANASTNVFTDTTFVDVLPFDGDDRGTTGLGGEALKLTEVEAAMTRAEQGNVRIEYSTDAAADIQAAVKTAGNETASVGVAWSELTGAVPEGVTALRFTPIDGLKPGFDGSATVKVEIPALAVSGSVNNTVAMSLIAESGSNIITSSGASRPLQSSAVSISGSVKRDLDFSNTVSAADDNWASGADLVELRQGSTLIATADLEADGSYHLPLVAAGLYDVALASSEDDGWEQVLPDTLDAQPGTVLTADLLYQEAVSAPELVNDTATVSDGDTVDINVTDNDTLHFPQTDASVFTTDNVAIASTPVNGGTAVTVPTADGQSTIAYTPSIAWPVSAAGQSTYEDSFQYSWINAQGEAERATVTVTVIALPEAVADAATIRDSMSLVDVLGNDTGNELVFGAAPTVPAGTDATVAYENGKLQVTPHHVWVADEKTYTVPVTYSVTDSQGKTSSARAEVTVQRAPVATAQTSLATIPLGGSVTVDPALLHPEVRATVNPVVLQTPPAQGSVTVHADGTATFTAGTAAAGAYSLSLLLTDNLGQTTTVTYSVEVQGVPVATGGTATVGVAGSHVFTGIAQSTGVVTGSAVSVAPTAGSVSIDGDTIRYAAGTAAPGSYSFTVAFTDNFGQVGTADYTVTVQAAPVVTGLTSATIGSGATTTMTPTVETTGSLDEVVVTDEPAAGRVTVNQSTGAVTFDAESADAGTYTFVVTYTDNVGQSADVTFTVTVRPALAATGGTITLGEGQSFTFPDTVESQGAITGRELVAAPAKGAAQLIDGGVTYTAGTEAGEYSFAVEFTDDVDQQVTATYTVTVQAKPTAANASASMGMNAEHVFVPQITTAGAIVSADVVTSPAVGTATAGPQRVAFSSESAPAGTYTMTVVFTDNVGQTVPATFTVTVHEPLTVSGENSAIIGQNQTAAFTPVIAELANLESIAVTAVPSAGSATTSALLRSVMFDAHGVSPGTYSFTVTFTDSYGQLTPVEYTVNVLAQPTGADQTITMGQNGSVEFIETVSPAQHIVSVAPAAPEAETLFTREDGRVLFSTGGAELAPGTHETVLTYTDEAGQSVNIRYTVRLQAKPVATGSTANVALDGSHTFVRNVVSASTDLTADVTQPEAGRVELAENGDIVYVAGDAPVGTYTFAVTFTDEFGQQGTADYAVSVQAGPVVDVESSQIIPERGTAQFEPTISTENALESVTVEQQPAAGRVTVDEASGAVEYGAGDARAGEYTFVVKFADALGQSVNVSFTVTVQGKPVATGTTHTVAEAGEARFDENVTTTGTIVKREIIQQPAEGTAVLGSVIYQAGTAQPGTYEFVVRYTDDLGQFADATYSATVQAAPRVKGDLQVTVPFGTTSVLLDTMGAVTGTNLLPLDSGSFTVPTHGTVELNSQGTLSYLPPAGFVGTASFDATITDDLGQTVVVTHRITVEPAMALDASDQLSATGGEATGGFLVCAFLLLGGAFVVANARRNYGKR